MLTDFQELWLTSRKNVFPKNNEFQSINVVKTCEKLRLALTRACNGLQRTQDISHRHTAEELSFRSISRLCYTTLRIHELQVNDLLNKSKELVAQSKDWSTVQAKKRSQPTNYSTTYCAKRKRRGTVACSLQDVTVINYTQLLDETAKFVEWGKTTEIVNKMVSKTNSHSRTTCIHIHEITINEIDTHSDHYNADEDDGFGNTPGDELATIIQLLTDEHPKAPKRLKVVDNLGVCEKKAKICEALQGVNEIPEIEAPRNADVEYVTNNLFIPTVNNDCDNSIVNEFRPSHAEISVNQVADGSVASENNDNYVEVTNSFNLDKRSSAPTVTDKSSNCQKQSLNKSKSKHSKTIIDAYTVLTQSEMRAQLQTQINIKTKLRKIRAKVKWSSEKNFTGGKRYEKLLPSANELLTTLQHNCIAFRKYKLKNKVRRPILEISTSSVTYRSLLCEILNREITEDLATQIYKKWNQIEKRNQRTINNVINYTSIENVQVLQEDTHYNERSLLPNNTMAVEVFNNNNNNLQQTNRNCSPSSEQDEWGAYDVMIKLLNMWRSQIVLVDEIPVESLFPQTTIYRKAAAKGFDALLRLAANGFVVLFTAEHSKHLQCIKLGAASNKLIQRTERSSEMVSRRLDHGFHSIVS